MRTGRHQVQIGSFVASQSADGDDRAVTRIAGWDDGAPVRLNMEPKAGRDGGWDAAGQSDPRVIEIDGYVGQTSHAAAQAVAAQLSALRPRVPLTLTVENTASGVKSAQVRVSGQSSLEWLNDVEFTYTIQLTAPDPLLYGGALFASTGLSSTGGASGLTFSLAFPLDFGTGTGVIPGSLILPNAGTGTYWPRLRIDGPITNPVVSVNETGDLVKYTGSLVSGQWLDVDLANRKVLLQGQVSVMPAVTFSGNWLGIPPGGGTLSLAADTADPAALLSAWFYESAWD